MGRARIWLWGGLAVLLLCGAAPAQSDPDKPVRTSEHVHRSLAKSLESVAASLKAANEAQAYNPDCPPGKDDRKSDLCAQWKAADAANRSAIWTERTFLLGLAGTLVGVFTLGSAVAAAVYAKHAAVHAGTAAKASVEAIEVAKDSTRRQLRAYMSFKEMKFGVDWNPERGAFMYLANAVFVNSGATPAKKCTILADWIVANDGTPPEKDWEEKRGPDSYAPAGPNVTVHSDDLRIASPGILEVSHKRRRLFFCARCEYEDIWGEKWWTEICVRTHPLFKPDNLTMDNRFTFETPWSVRPVGPRNTLS